MTMQEQPLIHGVTHEQEKKEAIRYLDHRFLVGREPIEGEEPKTEKEKQIIQMVNLFLVQEFERLEIEEPFIPILPEQIHLLSREVYKTKTEREDTSHGFAVPTAQAVCINKNSSSQKSFFATVFHEMVHLASHQKYSVHPENKKVQMYRIGYGVINQEGKDKFRGFNEFLTDAVVYEIWRRHIDELQEKLSFTKEEVNSISLSYFNKYKGLFRGIITQMAENGEQKPQEIADRILKGMFTGEMMHLRDIKKVYGENALEILSLLGKRDVLKDEAETIDKKVTEYFHETDEGKRKAIAEELLTKYKHDK